MHKQTSYLSDIYLFQPCVCIEEEYITEEKYPDPHKGFGSAFVKYLGNAAKYEYTGEHLRKSIKRILLEEVRLVVRDDDRKDPQGVKIVPAALVYAAREGDGFGFIYVIIPGVRGRANVTIPDRETRDEEGKSAEQYVKESKKNLTTWIIDQNARNNIRVIDNKYNGDDHGEAADDDIGYYCTNGKHHKHRRLKNYIKDHFKLELIDKGYSMVFPDKSFRKLGCESRYLYTNEAMGTEYDGDVDSEYIRKNVPVDYSHYAGYSFYPHPNGAIYVINEFPEGYKDLPEKYDGIVDENDEEPKSKYEMRLDDTESICIFILGLIVLKITAVNVVNKDVLMALSDQKTSLASILDSTRKLAASLRLWDINHYVYQASQHEANKIEEAIGVDKIFEQYERNWRYLEHIVNLTDNYSDTHSNHVIAILGILLALGQIVPVIFNISFHGLGKFKLQDDYTGKVTNYAAEVTDKVKESIVAVSNLEIISTVITSLVAAAIIVFGLINVFKKHERIKKKGNAKRRKRD